MFYAKIQGKGGRKPRGLEHKEIDIAIAKLQLPRTRGSQRNHDAGKGAARHHGRSARGINGADSGAKTTQLFDCDQTAPSIEKNKVRKRKCKERFNSIGKEGTKGVRLINSSDNIDNI